MFDYIICSALIILSYEFGKWVHRKIKYKRVKRYIADGVKVTLEMPRF